jgi:hypothetical protein
VLADSPVKVGWHMKFSLLRVLTGVVAISGLLVGATALGAGPADAAAGRPLCTGTPAAPGVLAGAFHSNVLVTGVCAVNGGQAVVYGNLTVAPGAALVAAFALNDVTGKGISSLRVTGKLIVQKGGSALVGCFASSFACLDDPNQSAPTFNRRAKVGGVVERRPLGVVFHDTLISGNLTEMGGGGGETCVPSGIFGVFGSPVYSDIEDSTVRGNLSITNLSSCWLGTARVQISGNAKYTNDQLADPDAIEILSNHVAGNLVCKGNSMVWDSADLTSNLYPRAPEPNTVLGKRVGQCVLASPPTEGAPPGPGPF